ncbi:gastrula zinc finger protein XlCGF71.1-like [Phlebotomus argentipes]|uniref:gastrula zinc finger protein XlCGF71.1-like n=1 Tax=Phlebotomus argentipes TaxID=94469 RepID=UPI0028932354|nr:gastrula zinc finger protein XlCGF71.1-like [Phlebotomus argentipes]
MDYSKISIESMFNLSVDYQKTNAMLYSGNCAEPEEQPEIVVVREDALPKPTFQCPTCLKVLKSMSTYRNHMKIHANQEEDAKQWSVCHYCNKVFYDPNQLKQHQLSHTKDSQALKCHHCYKPFYHRDALERHLKEHKELKDYRCLNCNKTFASFNYLKLHFKMHADEKPYKCSYCDKRFTFSSNLTVHTRIHTGHKPYRCRECNKCFTQINTLKQHHKVHEKEDKTAKAMAQADDSKSFHYEGNLITIPS